ncbi:PEP-CTERM sorting domain-containing protein [Azohydromonas australica]|uniref:PEP-CTERM sorting domain-containing protein n=1 Tax=Azohydromonas australica TaxID=364039 RepID=UPI001B7FC722|nr:PEP-CTERM sorting domain-containing protein [Azohydromonas australica]
MYLKAKRALIAASLLATTAFPALAVSTTFNSSATISNLHYEVIDLRPDDGIDAFAKIRKGTSGWSASRLGTDDGDYLRNRQRASGPFGSASSLVVQPGMMGSGAVVTNDGITKLTTAGIVGNTYGPYKGYNTWSGFDIAVELAPYSALKWSGSYAIDAWDRGSAGVLFGSISSGFDNDIVGEINMSFGQKSGDFSFLIQNTRDYTRVVNGGVLAWTSGGLNPIPEPSTYALMAAGLGMVGFVARRRKAS